MDLAIFQDRYPPKEKKYYLLLRKNDQYNQPPQPQAPNYSQPQPGGPQYGQPQPPKPGNFPSQQAGAAAKNKPPVAIIFKLALPRTALIIAPVIAFFLDIIARWQMRQALHRHRSKGSCKYRTVVIGSSDGINKALQTMRNCMNWGYEPVAVCPIEADPASKDAYVVTSYTPDANIEGSSKLKVIPFNSAFPRICESLGVQEVYVADVLSRDSEMLHGLSLAVESLGMELALAVSLADVSGHRLYLRNTTEQPVLLASLPQYTGAANVIKRLLDIIGSLCALIISSPILLGVAIAIKLDDGGPVFFSQTRIGLHGKPFKMYKFRSMVTNAEELKKKLAEETGRKTGSSSK